jgi:thiamine pyrophosphate-dependent acetolactate synthase large subunit-like protein
MDQVTSDKATSGGQGSLLDRRAVVARLLADRGDLLVVTGLGAPTYDVAAAGDDARNFYLWGAMGGAALLGLGLATAQPDRPVAVITGDGEQLMGLGGLATIGVQQPPNLSIIVIDNERYGETGGQPTHTARGVDLAAVARACGIANVVTARTMAEVAQVQSQLHARKGTLLAVIKVDPQDLPRVLPPRDGAWLARRFHQAVVGEPV